MHLPINDHSKQTVVHIFRSATNIFKVQGTWHSSYTGHCYRPVPMTNCVFDLPRTHALDTINSNPIKPMVRVKGGQKEPTPKMITFFHFKSDLCDF